MSDQELFDQLTVVLERFHERLKVIKQTTMQDAQNSREGICRMGAGEDGAGFGLQRRNPSEAGALQPGLRDVFQASSIAVHRDLGPKEAAR